MRPASRVAAESIESLRCVVQLIVQLLASFSELIHALSQTPRGLAIFRPEEDVHDEEDDKQIRAT